MRDRDQDSLLAGVKRAVVNWGGHLERTYSDDHGQYAVRLSYRGETFIAVAKQSAHHGLASFMDSVVGRAAHQDVLLLEFFGEGPTLGSVYVFRPDTVASEGRESHGASKQDVPTEWLELPLEHGCTLGDYITNRDVPGEPSSTASVEEQNQKPETTRPKLTDYA